MVLFVYGPLCNTDDFGHWVDWKHGINICSSKDERNSGKITEYLIYSLNRDKTLARINIQGL